MKLPLTSVLLLAGTVVTTQAQVLFSDNFDSQTVGNTVSGWTAVSPTTATASRGAVIISDNSPNQALRLFDTDSSNAARVEQDFASRSDVHLSLDFRRNADIAVDPSAASTTAFYVTIGGNGLSQNTQANRDLEFRLFSNGQYRIDRGTQDANGNFVASTLTSAQNFEAAGPTFNYHTLDIYMYDSTPGGATKAFLGPDNVSRVLDPNSFAVFIDDIFVTPPSGATANGDFGIFQSSIYGTDNNFGRLGLVTGGASSLVGMDYVVDNVAVAGIAVVPEPASFAFLGLGGLLLLIRRRFNR